MFGHLPSYMCMCILLVLCDAVLLLSSVAIEMSVCNIASLYILKPDVTAVYVTW